MTQPAEPDTPEPVSDDDATAAADDLAAAIANEQDLHRQSDTKAIGAFAAVGLIIAATSTALPRLDEGPLQIVLYGLSLTVASGITLGITLIPRYTPRLPLRKKPSSMRSIASAIRTIASASTQRNCPAWRTSPGSNTAWSARDSYCWGSVAS
jgi:hypothetical protein